MKRSAVDWAMDLVLWFPDKMELWGWPKSIRFTLYVIWMTVPGIPLLLLLVFPCLLIDTYNDF